MPSEKMRYIRQRMADKPCTDIEQTPLKAEIEAVSATTTSMKTATPSPACFRLIEKRLMNRSAKGCMPMPLPFCLKCLKALRTTLLKMSNTTTLMIYIHPIMSAKT